MEEGGDVERKLARLLPAYQENDDRLSQNKIFASSIVTEIL